MTLATTSRTCSVCRPTWILCCCGYEERGKRRIRRPLADGELSPRALQFRLRRQLMEGTAGPGSAQDASQGQPGAADEATPDPDKQAGGLPVGSDG